MKSISTYHLIIALVALFISYIPPFIVLEIRSIAAFKKEAGKDRSILKWSEGLYKR